MKAGSRYAGALVLEETETFCGKTGEQISASDALPGSSLKGQPIPEQSLFFQTFEATQ
jgi:hypothetical protein